MNIVRSLTTEAATATPTQAWEGSTSLCDIASNRRWPSSAYLHGFIKKRGCELKPTSRAWQMAHLLS
eukprot:scaffold237055_cov39-Prasinocladus_malaysianus.AAC.2